MMSLEIRNIEDLIKPSLKNGQKFMSCECEKLLSAGENYGSVMLQVKIKVLNENNEEEIIHCVGKTVPSSPLIWEMFNTKATFKKEINVYKKLVPALNEFGKENGIDEIIDFVPNCLAARISSNPDSNEVDKDAVILLENLKVQGFINCDRFVGFDLQSTKYLLNDLAIMHATAIAYKLVKPEDFKTTILPHLTRDFSFKMPDDILRRAIDVIQNYVSAEEKCIPYLPKIGEAIRKLCSYTTENPMKNERDLFATFTHNDFWVNNTMLKFENGRPIQNKMVDFQIIEYRSLAHDVVFFLYSSVEVSVLENYLDDLLKYYYERFTETLTKLKCDISSFTYEAMMEEFSYIAREEEFGHIMIMLQAIMILKDKSKDLSEASEEDMVIQTEDWHENCYKKMVFTVLDFVKRGWITN